jgi:RNA polymerase sigma-70 factor (ECF subfamily)
MANPTALGVRGSIQCVTDEELVALARQGDSDAFDQLVAAHQAGVYRAALAAMRAPEDAEEVTQDAFLRAWRNIGRFRGTSSFRTWVLKIAWNRAMTRRRSVANWLRRTVPLHDVMEPIDTLPGPDAIMQYGELRLHIHRAIQNLPLKLRDVLLLAQSGDYDYDEIGAMLGVPVGTVKWRVSEARKHVRATLVNAMRHHDAR